MKEQSHKEEMSAALRADFQRLRDRGVPATLVPSEAPAPAAERADAVQSGFADDSTPDVDGTRGPSPTLEHQAEAVVTPHAEFEQEREDRPAAHAPDDDPEPTPPRSGWLARLVGR